MNVRRCNDPATRECVESLGVCMCYVVLFLVSYKEKTSLKLNMYVPQNAAPLNGTTCSHTFATHRGFRKI